MRLAEALSTGLCAAAAEHDLTATLARALMNVTEPTPMSALAQRLGCDKSHVAGLVDGLEQRGLVARQSAAHDRRVRQLVLTEAGRRTQAALFTTLHEDAPVARLTPAEEVQLRLLLRRALDG